MLKTVSTEIRQNIGSPSHEDFANFDDEDDVPDVDGVKPWARESSRSAEPQDLVMLLEKKRSSEAGRWAPESAKAPEPTKAAKAQEVHISDRRAVNRGAQISTEVRSPNFVDYLRNRQKPSVDTGGTKVVSVSLSAAQT